MKPVGLEFRREGEGWRARVQAIEGSWISYGPTRGAALRGLAARIEEYDVPDERDADTDMIRAAADALGAGIVNLAAGRGRP